MLQVYYQYKARKQEFIRQEVQLRKMCFYIVAPYWKGPPKLQHMWQLWEIPEVDGAMADRNLFAHVRMMTEEEKEKIRIFQKGVT